MAGTGKHAANRPASDSAHKEAVRAALDNRAEDLFRQVWGEPVKAGAKEWRARSGSSRAMVMRGPKRGLWRDYSAREHGDVLDFVAVHFCGLSRATDDFARVLDEGARWCGLSVDALPDLSELMKRRDARDKAAEAEERAEKQRKASLVAELVQTAQPIAGTPAAAYLAGRAIAPSLTKGIAFLPPLRDGVLHPHRAALVVWATDDQGHVMGGQRILVMPDGSKAPEDPRKPSFGQIGGYPARFPAMVADAPLIVAEGPETALSIWQATGFETWAVFGAGGFEPAPLPIGRRVIVCPDRDAPDSPAGLTLSSALAAHAARKVDLWVADAPEPVGSKRDLNDTLQRAGADAVRAAIEAAQKYVVPVYRAKDGRFTGQGVVPCNPAPLPEFLTPDQAAKRIEDAVSTFLAKVIEGGDPSALVIAASPGAGKSRIARQVIGQADLSTLAGDVVMYLPTLALAEEAAAEANGHVTRGRGAINPATGTPMCDRADEAEGVAKAGLRVFPSLCERKMPDGQTVQCPHFATCAYLQQWAELPAHPVMRFEAHNYLTLPGDGSDRKTALRVTDEKVWSHFTGKADLPLDAWVRVRRPKHGKTLADEIEAAQAAADTTAAAGEVLAALVAGNSPVLSHYTAEDFAAFADAERGPDVLQTSPAASAETVFEELDRLSQFDPDAGKRAAVWSILSDCAAKGIERPERLRLVRGVPHNGDRRDVLRVTWWREFPCDVPVIFLDADARPELVDRMFPGAEFVRAELRGNAHVVQVCDRTFSKGSLIDSEGKRNGEKRQMVAALVRAEVYRDRLAGARGVLCIATRAIVRRMFEDAGHDFTGKDEATVNGVMEATLLHGARWLWFGPGSLGRNDWREFGTAVVIGREELPLDVLQDDLRAMFGDSGEPLNLIEEGEGANLPEVLTPYTMADGSGAGVMVRMHPDRRGQALQMQRRELATRQGFERLRLAHAPERKRLVIACKVPIPGLPVDELVRFEDLMPRTPEGRLSEAIAEAAQRGGGLRLSPAGLAADAPETFPTVKAAEQWVQREGRAALNTPIPLMRGSITGVGGFNPVRGSIRLLGQRGRATPVLVVLPGDPRAMAEAQFGPLAEFELEVDPASLCGVNEAAPVPTIEAEGILRPIKGPDTPVPTDAPEFSDAVKRADAVVAADDFAWRSAERHARKPKLKPKPAREPRPVIVANAGPILPPAPVRRLVILPEADQVQNMPVREPMRVYLAGPRRLRAMMEEGRNIIRAAIEDHMSLSEYSPDAWR